MDCRNRPSLVLLVMLLFAATLLFVSLLFASDDDGTTPLGVPVVPGEQALAADSHREGGEIPFEGADVFLELNNTAGDLGIHTAIDGGPWRFLEIERPDERRILVLRPWGPLRSQGMSFEGFESGELPFDELTPEEFFERFPEGEYEVSGVSVDGEELESLSEVTHVFAAAPFNVRVSGIPVPDGCDEEPPPVVSSPVVVTWDPVTESHPEIGNPGEIEVMTYLLQICNDIVDIEADLGPEITEFDVPAAISDSGGLYDFEIIVKESSGNNTVFASCFTVE